MAFGIDFQVNGYPDVQSAFDKLSGMLNGLAQQAAVLNVLPFGYERFTVRIVSAVTQLGPLMVPLGVAGGAFYGLSRGIEKLAKDGDRDAQTIQSYWKAMGESAALSSSQIERMSATLGKATGAIGLAKAASETFAGFTGLGVGRDPNSAAAREQAAQFEKNWKNARADLGKGEAEDARMRMLSQVGLKDLPGERDKIVERMRAETLTRSRTKDGSDEQKASDERLKVLNREFDVVSKRSVELQKLQRDLNRERADAVAKRAEADLAVKQSAPGGDEQKAAKKRLEDAQREIDLIDAKGRALHKTAELAAVDDRKARERAANLQLLADLQERMSRDNFDVSRIVTQDQVNAKLKLELETMQKLADLNELTDKDRAERTQRIITLIERRNQELDRERSIERELAEIRRLDVAAGYQRQVDSLVAQEQLRRTALGDEQKRLEIRRSLMDISTREQEAEERRIIESRNELTSLKAVQAVEKERLGTERAHVEALKSAARTAQERHSAEERLLNISRQAKEMEIGHARQLLQAEHALTAEREQQSQNERQRAMQRQLQEMQQALAMQQARLAGAGGVVEQMRGRVAPQQANLGVLGQRFSARVADEQKRLGRKLSTGEQSRLFNQVKAKTARDLRGPSLRQQQAELARQRQAERMEMRKRDAARATLPQNMRRMLRQSDQATARQNEAERMGAFRNGGLAQGMNAGLAGEQGRAVQSITAGNIRAMNQQGRISSAQAESMQVLNNSLSNVIQSQAELQQRVSIIGAQIESTNAASERVKAQRAGQQRY